MSSKKENIENSEETTENKEIAEEIIESKKDTEETTENTNDDKFEEIKIRKWLQIVLVIIAIIISVVLLWKTVMICKNVINNIQKSIEEEKEDWDKEFNNDEFRNKVKTDMFNGTFEFYAGTSTGNSLERFFDEIIKNNKTNKDHLISVTFDSNTTTNPDEITNLKKKLEDWTKYEVSLDYDENGYVISAKIEKY